MEQTHITITLKPIYLERLLYWIIIIALGILLIIGWGDENSDTETPDQQQRAVEGSVEQAAAPEEQETPIPTDPDETCFDGAMNQDETDIDCGGVCGGCSAGDSCRTADDCLADYCSNGICSSTAPVQLSGKVEMDLLDVNVEKAPTSDSIKVTDVRFSVKNGIEGDLGLLIGKVFLKSKRDPTYCLNQDPGGEKDCSRAYATFTFTGPDSGKTKTLTQDLDDRYDGASYASNYGTASYYEPGDELNVFLYIYDDDGSLIGGKEISDFQTAS